MKKNSLLLSKNRKFRVRKKLKEVAPLDRFRLSVFVSNRNIEAQIIDDSQSKTLVCVSSLQKKLNLNCGSNSHAAEVVGKKIGEAALLMGVDKVYLDRGSYLYRGKIRSFCEGARNSGLKF